MGWDSRTLEITGHVSRHNSQQDKDDDADWEEFVERVNCIAKEHRYEKLNLMVIGE